MKLYYFMTKAFRQMLLVTPLLTSLYYCKLVLELYKRVISLNLIYQYHNKGINFIEFQDFLSIKILINIFKVAFNLIDLYIDYPCIQA